MILATLTPALAATASPPTFTSPLTITNPYQPFPVGAVKVYNGRKDGKADVVVDLFLADTRTFQVNGTPVPCHILQETEFLGGQLIEISRNHFAQADDGTLYYFGEVVDEYESGVINSHEGSWLVGGPTDPGDPPSTANAPGPTVYMPAQPARGDVFKQEDLAPIVDETDTVKAVGLTLHVPGGTVSQLPSRCWRPRRSGTSPRPSGMRGASGRSGAKRPARSRRLSLRRYCRSSAPPFRSASAFRFRSWRRIITRSPQGRNQRIACPTIDDG